MTIRLETDADRAAIRALLLAAFPGPDEADLVERLRADGDAAFALVAIADDGAVAGHATFSRMAAPGWALGLGPVAVDAAHRRRGVAAALIGDGLGRAAAAGWKGVFVLGEPGYYRRFGFDAARAAGFESPHAGPYLMALALDGDDLPERGGRLAYPQAFAAFE